MVRFSCLENLLCQVESFLVALFIDSEEAKWVVTPVSFGPGEQEYIRNQDVLQSMWMVHLDQAGRLQGLDGVNCHGLAANNLGTGSGWQQSKQNWVLPAVVGY